MATIVVYACSIALGIAPAPARVSIHASIDAPAPAGGSTAVTTVAREAREANATTAAREAGAATAATADSRPSPRAIADDAVSLERALRQLLGDPAALRTTVYPPDPGSPGGVFPLVEARIDDGPLASIPVGRLRVTARDVAIERAEDGAQDRTPRIRRGTVTHLEVSLDAHALALALTHSLAGRMAHALSVTLASDRIIIEGKIGRGPWTVSARLWGRAVLADGGRAIAFVLDGADLGPLAASQDAIRAAIQRCNPLVDLDTFAARTGIDVRLTSLDIEDGRLVIRGGEVPVPPALSPAAP